MRGWVRRKQAVEAHEWGFLLRLVILALCFSVGVVLGQGLARRAPAGTEFGITRLLQLYHDDKKSSTVLCCFGQDAEYF